jgi:ketosteroid isomerase-like protein
MHFSQVWTFRDGRAVRMELYWDNGEARRAAGLA